MGNSATAPQSNKSNRLDQPTLATALTLNLLKQLYWIDDMMGEKLAALGERWWATRSQRFVVLNIAAGVNRASDIARNLGVTRQSVSLMIKDLEQRGIVDVVPDPDHRRSKIVTFNAEFDRFAEVCLEIGDETEASLREYFGDEVYADFHRVLKDDWLEAIPVDGDDAYDFVKPQ